MAITIRDVAREADLSMSTVSKYLNNLSVRNKNRKLIEAAIKKLDFKPNAIARGLKNSKTRLIGIPLMNTSDEFIFTIVAKISQELSKSGYGLIVCYSETTDKLAEFIIDKMVDGVITFVNGKDIEYLLTIKNNHTPIVLLDQNVVELACDAVVIDNFDAAYNATSKLIELGHKRIALIRGTSGFYTAEERFAGYKKALYDNGISYDEALTGDGVFLIDGGYKVVMDIWKNANRLPTAILSSNYFMTIGAISAFNELGIVIGKDISFITFDNMLLSKVVSPKLTSIEQPIDEICRVAAELVLKCIANGCSNFPQTTMLKTELILTDSIFPVI